MKGGVGKCGGRCEKVCWGVRKSEGKCGDRFREVCWGVGGDVREDVGKCMGKVWGSMLGCGGR